MIKGDTIGSMNHIYRRLTDKLGCYSAVILVLNLFNKKNHLIHLFQIILLTTFLYKIT